MLKLLTRRLRGRRGGEFRRLHQPLPQFIERLEARTLLAVSLPSGFSHARVANGLTSPTALVALPDSRILVAQQDGKIRVIKNDVLVSTPFASVSADTYAERGLLGITIDPNFASNKYVYVYYTAKSPTIHNRVSRFTASGDVASGSETVLFDLPTVPSSARWHMGGGIHFGSDGKLYVAVGQHEDTSKPQSLSSVFGKMLRINKDGTIPTDNPFYSQTSGINRAIWARGLRNPYTFAVQPGTGRMMINDVGESSYEEIDVGKAGGNYGWPQTEGPFSTSTYPQYIHPIYWYSHSQGCSITGGAFYNPATGNFPSTWVGKYFWNEFCAGVMRAMDPATGTNTTFATGLGSPTDMQTADDGSIYYISRNDTTGELETLGSIWKIRYSSSGAPAISQHPTNQKVAVGEPATFTVSATGSGLSYRWQRNGVNISGATSPTYTIASTTLADNNAQFRCVVSNSTGSTTSNAAALLVVNGKRPVASITSPSSGALYTAGDVISYSGTGTDNEEGSLSSSQFEWDVVFHHGTHTHPFIPAFTGVKSGTFEIPRSGHTEPDVWYRIRLTVTDSTGLSNTVFRDVNPRTSTFTIASNPSGLYLTLDGQPTKTPAPVLGVVGTIRQLDAPQTLLLGTTTYEFDSWSDGGARTHAISVAPSNTTYTANYKAVPVTFVSDLPFAQTPTNGWGPVERDKSNGGTAAGDGGTLTLNGVTYAKGLGTHANSDVRFNLNGGYTRFISDVGIDDAKTAGSAIFQVWVDGVKLFDSGVMTGSSANKTVDINVAGKNQLRLIVSDAGDGNSSDHADWAGARLMGSGSTPGTSVTLISTGATWKYLDNGTNQGTAWRAIGFSDTAWKSGAAKLGYGDGDEKTIVSFGPSSSAKYITTYFRKNFDISDPAAVSALSLRLRRDDGAVVYLNGTEVMRSNMPTGTISDTTRASSALGGSDETTFVSASINPSLLVSGNNVIAVEIHQSDAGSTDLSFDFELKATVSSGSATAPAAPSSLSATAVSSTQINLGWLDNSSDESGFRIERKTGSSGTWSEIATVGAGVKSYSDTGRAGGTTYFYRVRAYNAAGASGYSNESSATTPTSSTSGTLIAAGATWKYLDNGTNQGTAWRATAFSDTAWKSGAAELGYGDGGEQTIVSFGPSSSSKYITTYFRNAFQVADRTAYTALTMRLIRDDGAVVYLNGTEVFRNNMPTGTISYTTLASSALGGADESTWLSAAISPSLLVNGTNVIAVEIHQSDAYSSDMSFNFELLGSTSGTTLLARSAGELESLQIASAWGSLAEEPEEEIL